jgi:hypothetical protein
MNVCFPTKAIPKVSLLSPSFPCRLLRRRGLGIRHEVHPTPPCTSKASVCKPAQPVRYTLKENAALVDPGRVPFLTFR